MIMLFARSMRMLLILHMLYCTHFMFPQRDTSGLAALMTIATNQLSYVTSSRCSGSCTSLSWDGVEGDLTRTVVLYFIVIIRLQCICG